MNGTLFNYPRAKEDSNINPASFIERPCDILIPAAIERTVHSENAEKLQCKILVEAANGPCTFKADEILNRKGVVIIPDLLINTGGVTVSYFEWLKNIEHVSPGKLSKKFQQRSKLKLLQTAGMKITEHSPLYHNLEGANEMDIVLSGLEDFMTEAVRKHWNYSVINNINFRDACYLSAIMDLYNNFKDRGIAIS